MDVGALGEGEDLIDVDRCGYGHGWAVRGIFADAEAFDADGVEELDERLVSGVEVGMVAFCVGQSGGGLKAEAEEVLGYGLAFGVRVNVDRDLPERGAQGECCKVGNRQKFLQLTHGDLPTCECSERTFCESRPASFEVMQCAV